MSGTNETANRRTQTGMVLPFQPLSLSFNHMNYYVDMPAVSYSSKMMFITRWRKVDETETHQS